MEFEQCVVRERVVVLKHCLRKLFEIHVHSLSKWNVKVRRYSSLTAFQLTDERVVVDIYSLR